MTTKRFPASPRRLREARERGEVPHGSDLTGTAAFFGALLGIAVGARVAPAAWRALWDQAMRSVAGPGADLAPEAWLALATALLLRVLGPVLLATAACAVVVSFLQVGPVMAWKKLRPDLSRLDPAKGLGRIFSLNSAFTLVKVILKAGLLAAVVWGAIRRSLDGAVQLGRSQPLKVFDVAAPLLLQVFAWAGVVYVLVSAADVAFQRFDHLRKQRMTLEELRREQRDAEGDPTTSARQRGVRLEALFSALPDRMRLASAVVYGPGVSVALLYQGAGSLPRVIAKGRGEAAAQIRALALQALLPLAYDTELAERLECETPLDQAIARGLFVAVARLLRWAGGQDDPGAAAAGPASALAPDLAAPDTH